MFDLGGCLLDIAFVLIEILRRKRRQMAFVGRVVSLKEVIWGILCWVILMGMSG